MNDAAPSVHASALRSRRWLLNLAWAVGLLVLFWALAWLAAPWIVKQQIEKHASAQLGRVVTVGQVEFLPWTLELTLNDFSVAGRDSAEPQLQVRRIYVNAELESLLRLAPVIQAVQIDAPHARLAALGDGRFDVDDIIQRLASEPGASNSDPQRFAVFNIAVQGGALDFDDQTVSRQHQVRNFQLAIPFLSNLSAHRDTVVEPRLALDFNGSHIESAAQARPFVDTRNATAHFTVQDMDLAPYLPYLPDSLPVRLTRAVASVDLTLEFEQREQPRVRLRGTLQGKNVAVTDQSDRPLLAFDALNIRVDDLRPLERIVRLGDVQWTAPRLALRRDRQGQIELPMAAAPSVSAGAPTKASTAAGVASSPAPAGPSGPGGDGWDVAIAQLDLRGGEVTWSDASVQGGARLWLHDLGMELKDLSWPVRQDGRLRGSFGISAGDPARAPSAATQGARIQFEGTATDQAADVQVGLERLAIPLADPYLSPYLVPALRGELEGALRVQWAPSGLKLDVANLHAERLELRDRDAKVQAPLASIGKVALGQTLVDLQQRSVQVSKLVVDQPRFALARDRDGRWMFEEWFRGDTAPAQASGGSRKEGNAPSAVPPVSRRDTMPPSPADAWTMQVKEFDMDAGNVVYEDRLPPKPVTFAVSGLRVQMGDWQLDGKRPGPLRVAGTIQAGQASPGQLQYQGNLQIQPLLAQGNVTLSRLPLHAFVPYFGERLNIELLRADTSFRGALRYADMPQGMQLRVAGDTTVDDFRANSLASTGTGLPVAEELLNWKTLNLRGLTVDMVPGKAPAIAVQETSLSDFYARLIIFESGRINLQDLVKPEPGSAAAVAAAAPASVPQVPSSAAAAPAGGTQVATPAVADPLAPVVQFGPVSLINGRVLFSDRFVKPNYSADLSDLTGKLGAFSSVAPQGQLQLADLELRGRAEGTASLEIIGKLNPLAQPLALDIQGKVRDLELPPLSTYSIKYAGHGIQRGKLSLDVGYRIQPDGQLTASNKLVLNQLAFGDAVQGAPNSLPVRLAVALLADRNGVIDLDLPVSGSLNDPQFSVAPIIFKAIANLIVKAITAPFSLLANALGGSSDQLSTVAFAPGTASLSDEAKGGLDKVAKALQDRPALRMTVTGAADLERERDAFQKERLQALLVAEKRRQMLSRGAAAEAVGAQLQISPEERPALLKEVFQRADITKPRNAVGAPLTVAPADMESLLLANIEVTEEAMRELAVRRGVVVKDYLSMQNLPVDRLFLGAAKTQRSDEKWTPHAELNLSTN